MDDPAGLFFALGIKSSSAIKFFRYLLFAICVFCWSQIRNNKNASLARKQPVYNQMLIVIGVWSLFYFLVYAGLNSNESLGLADLFAKHNRMIIGIFAFFITAQVAAIGFLSHFVKRFTLVLIIVGVLSLITAFTSLNLVQVGEYTRHFTSVKRIVFVGGKIIYFILPLGITQLALNIERDYKIYTAFVLVFTMVVVAILRRWMFAVVIYSVIIYVITNYIKRLPLIALPKKVTQTAVVLILSFSVFIGILRKEYLLVLGDTAKNLIGFVQGNIDENTADDERVSFTKQKSMLNAFKDNLYIGTGYDEKWFNNKDKNDKWEGADYIFLGVLGQFGILGIMIFLFFYILIFRTIIKGISLIRRNWLWIRKNNKQTYFFVMIFIATSAEFIRNLLEYPNWFVPISASSFGYLYFIYAGMLIGSQTGLKLLIRQSNMKKITN